MATQTFGCTVVSIMPIPLESRKPGLIPGLFKLPASDGKEPLCLVVYDSKYNVYIDDTRGSLPVREAADGVARSIVSDFVEGQLGANEGARPGLFWVVGEWTSAQIKDKYSTELLEARIAQQKWFIEICKIADNDWNRYHQHNVISDFQRKAAELLGYTRESHEWMAPHLVMSNQSCPACSQQVPAKVVICPNCHCVLDAEKYKTLVFAKKG
jgi:hypothetical protein